MSERYVVDLEAVRLGELSIGRTGAIRMPVHYQSGHDHGEALLAMSPEAAREVCSALMRLLDDGEEGEAVSHHGRTMSQAEALHHLLHEVKALRKEVKDGLATLQDQFNVLQAQNAQMTETTNALVGGLVAIEDKVAEDTKLLQELNQQTAVDFQPVIDAQATTLAALQAARQGLEAALAGTAPATEPPAAPGG